MTVLKLEGMLTDKTAFRTKSDCESVIHLYESRPHLPIQGYLAHKKLLPPRTLQ